MSDPSQYDDENWDSNDDYPDFDEPVSKSELKRQSAHQQEIGEPEPIETALAKLQHQHNEHNALFHKLEKARDAIADQGDSAIEPLLSDYPQLERQKLRQFHRAIVKERSNNKPPKAYRELFQYLKGAIVE